MSLSGAATWSRSRVSISLSVVPTSVRPSHGSANMNRPPPDGTIAPERSGSLSDGTVMWVPREGRITGTSASSRSSVGRSRSAQTPVALTTLAARIANRSPLIRSSTSTPSARPSCSRSSRTSTWFRQTAPNRSASWRIVSTRRLSSVWQS